MVEPPEALGNLAPLQRFNDLTIQRFNDSTIQRSPKMPLPPPHNPQAEEQIRDCVGGHRVTEALLAADEPLEGEAANEAGEPFAVLGGEERRSDEKRPRGQCPERHAE